MSKRSTQLKVEGLPRDATVCQLSVLLSNKRRQGGGPIETIQLTNGIAIVTFEQSDAVDLILSRGDTVKLNDVTVNVSRYFDPDDTQLSMKRSRIRSKGNLSAIVDESDDLSDREHSTEKVKMKSKKSLNETEKNEKTAGVKKQHAISDEEAKPRRQMSKTYSQASDDEHINSSDEKESLPRESKFKSPKPMKEKAQNKSSMFLKAYLSAKENVEQNPKVSKYPISQNKLSDTESRSNKPSNRKHTSLKEISAKKKSSVAKKTTSDSDEDSQFYRKRSKANPRNISDDESSNESTESESSSEKSEIKIDFSRKKSPKKEKSSVAKKTTSDSDGDSQFYRKRSKANPRNISDDESSNESTESESSSEKSEIKIDFSRKKSPKIEKSSVAKKTTSESDEDSQFYRKRSKANPRNISDDESSNESTESESSSEKSEIKIDFSRKKSPKKEKSSVAKKTTSDSDGDSQFYRKRSKANPRNISDDESSNESTESESSSEKSEIKIDFSRKKSPKIEKSSVAKKTTSESDEDSQFYRKRSKANPRNISDDESSNESTESESSSMKSERKLDFSRKRSPEKEKSSVAKKTTSDSYEDSQFYRKRSKANPRNITADESLNKSTESESSLEKSERKNVCSRQKTLKKAKSSVINKVKSDSENSQEENIDEPAGPWRLTIKASVADITKTKDFYVMYFDDPHISQGEFYEESFLLDGLNRNLYVTFCDRKAALATVSFKHKAESNLLKVEMAKKEDFYTYSNLISVHGCVFSTADQKIELKKTIEKIFQMEVKSIIQQDEPRSAIIVFSPDSCKDISATTWKSVYFDTTRLIVAPVFKTNSIKVTGLHHMSSHETLKRYLSNTKRSGGGEIAFFQQLSKTEARLTFKERTSVDGVARNVHQLDGTDLHVIEYHPCLTTEVYKKQVEPLMEPFMNNTEAFAGLHSGSSRQMFPRKGPVATRPLQLLQSKLNCKKTVLYTFIDRSSTKRVFKLCKFGYEFLKRKDVALTKIMHLVHCKFLLDPGEMSGSMILSLNWPQKLKYFEVKQLLDEGLEKVNNFLDTFTVAQFEVPRIREFQKYYFEVHEEKSLDFDIFFDHLDTLACVIISKQDEQVMENSMNALYQEFMTSIIYPTVSDHNRSHINVCQSGENRLQQNENSSQHTSAGMDSTFENLGYDGKQELQSAPNSNDRNRNSKKKGPPDAPKPCKEKNTTERQVEYEDMNVQLTMEQKLELQEKSYEKAIPFSRGKQTCVHKYLRQDLKQIPDALIPMGAKMCDRRQIYLREGHVATRPLQMLQSRLNCKKVSLYTFVDRSSTKRIFKLCKFGYEFLKRQDIALTQIMDSVHCKHILDPGDMAGSMLLSLNWPHKMKYFEIMQMVDDGMEKVKNFLDTFTVAQFKVPEMCEFQQYYLEICEEKSLDFDIFFEHLDKLACVIISKQDEQVMENSMNTLYQEFMTSILYLTISDHNRSRMNVCQSGESRL